MLIEAVLFDADGVIQRPSEGRRRKWEEVLGSTANPEEFLEDIFAAELTAVEGQSDFMEALSKVLSRWECRGTLRDALDAWTMIEVEVKMTDIVKALRRMDITCYLATNQEPYRARYMSEALGYRDLFDGEFYSCRIGVAKPRADCFRNILKQIKIPASHVLFLDDHQVNVDSARSVGLHANVFNLEAGVDALHGILREFGIHVA